ncbi:MAG: hypothetical protein A2527_09480 [Candidatus Lambdaproteobacteria bacterium RIFOXYD2_FULL_50_16]|uniref:Uncharacterized protein n=1 Tax=Candidatus Lambdaproteobacteria bacterium RIFOXYD2_FULL_50_16 TaxID=1817772 RepID=A0A1F6G7J8_9PROT|nr:MAG: hypothetical protein A2527_09480 [Candidatus Lambdaproteobacteria bacterium RIFOXYD2_FULL_50_16]
MRRTLIWLTGLALLTAGCGPDLTIYSTRPGELGIEGIDNLVVGEFKDQLGAPVTPPGDGAPFVANRPLALLVKSEVAKGLSKSGDYRILPSLNVGELQGRQPELAKTAVLSAEVRYYELDYRGYDDILYVLMARNNGKDLMDSLGNAAIGAGIAAAAEAAGKGFKVPTPLVERAGALEVTFHLTKASDGSKLVEPVTKWAYWHKKWGGDESKSQLDPALVEGFEKKGLAQVGFSDKLADTKERVQLKYSNPDEYVALGLHLADSEKVPLLDLDIENLLAQSAAQDYVKLIARHHVPAKLDLASGDAGAVALIKGGAYNEAINRLEGLPSPLAAADLYNLGLAYEANGEFAQARRNYQMGLDQDPNASSFKAAMERVKH